MSYIEDFRKAKERYPQHVEGLILIFKKHEVRDVSSAWKALSSIAFRDEMTHALEAILRSDGGKVSSVTLFAIIGASLGGVGIAAMGGAIGVPLALVGAILGLAIGNELDSEGHADTLMNKFKAFWNA